MEIDYNKILESPTTQKGLSLTFIAAAVLLLLSNIGIEISFAKISITNIFSKESLTIIQLYIIGTLFSLAYTIIKRTFLNPFIESESLSHRCYSCDNSMKMSEMKCSNCGSTFTFSKENNKKE
jgi:hypothetical protein